MIKIDNLNFYCPKLDFANLHTSFEKIRNQILPSHLTNIPKHFSLKMVGFKSNKIFFWKKVARWQQLKLLQTRLVKMYKIFIKICVISQCSCMISFFVYNLQKYEICAQRNALEKHFKIYYIFYKYENLRIVFFIFPFEYPRL